MGFSLPLEFSERHAYFERVLRSISMFCSAIVKNPHLLYYRCAKCRSLRLRNGVRLFTTIIYAEDAVFPLFFANIFRNYACFFGISSLSPMISAFLFAFVAAEIAEISFSASFLFKEKYIFT